MQWSDHFSSLSPLKVMDQATGSFAPPGLRAALATTACPLQGFVLEGAAVATAHLLLAGHALTGPGAGLHWPSRTAPRGEPAGGLGVGWGCGAGAPLCATQQHLVRQSDGELRDCVTVLAACQAVAFCVVLLASLLCHVFGNLPGHGQQSVVSVSLAACQAL